MESNEVKSDFKSEYIVHWTKKQTKIDNNLRKICKVLKFNSEWNQCLIANNISRLKPSDCPFLFIFIVESNNLKDFDLTGRQAQELKNSLLQFAVNRPLILEIRSITENESKFYFKNEDSVNFIEITAGSDSATNLSTLLSSYTRGTELNSFIDNMIHELPEIVNCTTIIRFLRTLNLPEAQLTKIILNCAKKGSKSQLLAALDVPLEDDSCMLNIDSQNILCSVFDFEGNKSTSILSQAVNNPDKNVIDYLISNCTHLIQQLPFNHRVHVSTIVYQANKFEILSNLISRSDFPFPEGLNEASVDDPKIRELMNKRKDFHDLITNKGDISAFIDDNPNLKIVYNINNQSALYKAIKSKNFASYTLLKSKGYESEDFEELPKLTEAEQEIFDLQKWTQTKQNANKARPDEDKSVYLLLSRSLIHNRMIDKENEKFCRNRIKKWLEKLYKISACSKFMDCAAQCDDLKIIFDFERYSVSLNLFLLFLLAH